MSKWEGIRSYPYMKKVSMINIAVLAPFKQFPYQNIYSLYKVLCSKLIQGATTEESGSVSYSMSRLEVKTDLYKRVKLDKKEQHM